MHFVIRGRRSRYFHLSRSSAFFIQAPASKMRVHQRQVDKRVEFLACILDAAPAACIKKSEDLFGRTTRDFRTPVAKRIECE